MDSGFDWQGRTGQGRCGLGWEYCLRNGHFGSGREEMGELRRAGNSVSGLEWGETGLVYPCVTTGLDWTGLDWTWAEEDINR